MIQGVNQIQVQTLVNEKLGENRAKNYEEAIAGALRSDPDILMIGEIRYAEAAEAAIHAALTGHGVWATIHANDAWSCIKRLESLLRQLNIVEPLELIAEHQVLQGLSSQRLIPTLCPNCKERLVDLSDSKKAKIGYALIDRVKNLTKEQLDQVYVRGEGCSYCQQRGHVAMTICAETVLLEEDLLKLIRNHKTLEAQKAWKEAGGSSIRDSCLRKILLGKLRR